MIRRTEYGVPHIKATSLYGVTPGLGCCELDDYGERVVHALVAARVDAVYFPRVFRLISCTTFSGLFLFYWGFILMVRNL